MAVNPRTEEPSNMSPSSTKRRPGIHGDRKVLLNTGDVTEAHVDEFNVLPGDKVCDLLGGGEQRPSFLWERYHGRESVNS